MTTDPPSLPHQNPFARHRRPSFGELLMVPMYTATEELESYGCANGGPICSREIAAELRAMIAPLFHAAGGPHLHVSQFIIDPGFRAIWSHVLQLLASSPAMEMLHRALGPSVCILSGMSLFRLVIDGKTSVPFHQDVNFTGNAYRMINCWMPLDDCGTTAPGLEVVRRRFRENLHITGRKEGAEGSLNAEHYLGDTLSDIMGAEAAITASLGPSVQAGTGLLFDQYCLHRTQPMSGNFNRIAVELRMASLLDVLETTGGGGQLAKDALFIISQGSDAIRITQAQTIGEVPLNFSPN